MSAAAAIVEVQMQVVLRTADRRVPAEDAHLRAAVLQSIAAGQPGLIGLRTIHPATAVFGESPATAAAVAG